MNTLTPIGTDLKVKLSSEMYRDDMAWIQVGGGFTPIQACKPMQAFLYLSPVKLLDYKAHYGRKSLWKARPINEFFEHEHPSQSFMLINSQDSFKEVRRLIEWGIRNKSRILVLYTGQDTNALWRYFRSQWIKAELIKINGTVTLVGRKW